MSAFDRLMTAGSSEATPGESSQSSDTASSKVEKRYSELAKRREKALRGTKGTARWWKYFDIVCTRDKDSDAMTGVHLLCKLCDTKLSASNESRIADSHLKHAGCSKVKSDPETAATVVAAFVKEGAAPEPADEDEQQILQQVQNKKRKAQPSVADVYLSQDKQNALSTAFYDFFLEASDCVAMHSCEHPAVKRFCKMVGIPPLNRKVGPSTHPVPVLDIPLFCCGDCRDLLGQYWTKSMKRQTRVLTSC